jgi:hypothetical protein
MAGAQQDATIRADLSGTRLKESIVILRRARAAAKGITTGPRIGKSRRAKLNVLKCFIPHSSHSLPIVCRPSRYQNTKIQ